MPKTKHRSPREGSITRRADGRWQGALQVGGNRRTVYGATRQEAARKLVEVQRQASKTGSLPNPGKRTLGDLIDAWLAVKSPTVKPRTMADYEDICERYLLPPLWRNPAESSYPRSHSVAVCAMASRRQAPDRAQGTPGVGSGPRSCRALGMVGLQPL